MGSDWPIRELKDVARQVTVGFVGTMAEQYTDTGVLFLRSLNVRPFSIDTTDVKFISEEFHRKIAKSALYPGDVVIVRTGRPGTCAVVSAGLGEVNCSDLVIVRCGEELRPHFLCYWVNAMATHHVAAHAVGAVQQHFNVASAKVIPLPVPPLSEQDRVLSILRAIDERIENLGQLNATLEAIAQALFKSWFVDFDPVRAKAEGREPEGMDAATAALFPGTFKTSGLGLIPEGWKVSNLGDQLEILSGGTPKTKVPEYWDGDIPWFSVVDAPKEGQVFVFDTERRITQSGLENSPARLLPANTTIISARGTVGKLAVTGQPMAMNQSCYGLRPADGVGEFFTYLSVQRFVDHLQRIAHGAVFDTITRSSFTQAHAVKAPEDVISAFEALVRSLMERIHANGRQANTLTRLRDALLPRLISGKLGLPDAEAQIEALA